MIIFLFLAYSLFNFAILINYRIIEYLGLNKPRPEFARRNVKPEPYKTKLKINETLNFYVSILMSIFGILLWITMPFALLEEPCEIFKKKNIYTFYEFVKTFQKYMPMMDRLIVSVGIILVVVSISTIVDAINNTKINLSPWIEQGKYKIVKKMPVKVKTYERQRFSFKRKVQKKVREEIEW